MYVSLLLVAYHGKVILCSHSFIFHTLHLNHTEFILHFYCSADVHKNFSFEEKVCHSYFNQNFIFGAIMHKHIRL